MGITMNYNDVIMENPLIFPNRDDLMEKSRVQQVQHQQNVGFNTSGYVEMDQVNFADFGLEGLLTSVIAPLVI